MSMVSSSSLHGISPLALRFTSSLACLIILYLTVPLSWAAERLYDTSMGGCKTFNLTSNSDGTLEVRQWATVFDTTECMRVSIESYDPETEIWTVRCFGDFHGKGTGNQTAIPPSMCEVVNIPPDTTMTFRIEYTVCNDNCTSACNCIEYAEENLPSLSSSYTYTDAMCGTDTTCPSGPTPAPVTGAPTLFPITDAPTKAPVTDVPSNKPSSEPSSLPSKTPSGEPSSQPSSAPITSSPTKAPVTDVPSNKPSSEPSSQPSSAPITSSPVQAPTTDSPSSKPSVVPTPGTVAPTQQPTSVAEYDPTTGDLVACGTDADCGGFGVEGLGATCIQNPTGDNYCECDSNYCLSGPTQNEKTCVFECNCEKECDINGSWTKISDRCGAKGDPNFQCTSCAVADGGADMCTADEDCVGDTDPICVGSSICTRYKGAMCDTAYAAMSGSNNNRAKCCPATSGCIKGTIGVVATSSCSSTCGNSCLGMQDNPGAPYGYSPSTFCIFGSRIENMIYCPTLAEGTLGQYSCKDPDGTGDQEGDNTVCCTTLADDPPTPTDGMFTCTENQYGYSGVNTTWSPDGYQMCIGSTDSLTGIAGRIIPLCSECCPAP